MFQNLQDSNTSGKWTVVSWKAFISQLGKVFKSELTNAYYAPLNIVNALVVVYLLETLNWLLSRSKLAERSMKGVENLR